MLLRVLALPVTVPLYLWWLWINTAIAVPVWGFAFALRAISWLFGLPAASPVTESAGLSGSCHPVADDSALWRTNDLYVSPRRVTSHVTPRTVKSPTPRGLRRFPTVGPSAGTSTPAAGAATPPTASEKPSADALRLSLFLPRSGRLTAKALLESLQSLVGNRRDAAAGHRVHRCLRLSTSLPRRFQQAQPSPARPAAGGAGQQPAVAEASRAADGGSSAAPSSPDQKQAADTAAVGQQAAAQAAPPASEPLASGMGADGGSSPATSNQQQAALLPARRTGSLRRPSTDSAFDVAEQLPPPLPPPSPLRSSQPAARPGPKQHADLLLQRLPGDAGTAALSQASGGDDERGGDGDLQERPSMMQCVECTAGISPAIADAPASAAPAPPAFCSPLRHISAVGSPGTSATDGSPSLPCPAAYVLRRGGIEGPAVPATAPRPRRLSGLYAPPAAQHPAASPVMRNSNWVSSGAAASAGGINGAVGNSTTSGTTAAAAAVPEAPLSPTGAAVVFVHATAANAAVMAALSSDRSQVAAAAACALTSDGGSVAGSVAGSASGAAARNGAAVKSSSGGAGAAGKRYPASVCGGSAQPVSRAGRVTTQRSATSTRQSAAGAYAGGGGGGAGTVSSGSSSAVGGLHGAGGALPRYLQPTASFAAKQARK